MGKAEDQAAGMAGAMKRAELGLDGARVSRVPGMRAHSVCAQGGINSVNATSRALGDSEWLHLDDTVYGGDFLNHQPPVKEMADWGPKVIDLLDRLRFLLDVVKDRRLEDVIRLESDEQIPVSGELALKFLINPITLVVPGKPGRKCVVELEPFGVEGEKDSEDPEDRYPAIPRQV